MLPTHFEGESKKIGIFLLIFACSTLAFGISFAQSEQNPAGFMAATQVITFKPESFQGKTHVGFCFASSIALERSDAWRCQVGTSIYDPCFATKVKNRLICDADPVTNKLGFPLQVVKKWPRSTNTSSVAAKPWILMLSDGSVCYPHTGTMPIISYENSMVGLKYSCVNKSMPGQQSGIIDGSIDKSDPIWRAKQMIYSVQPNIGPQVIQVIPALITTVWQ